MDKLNTTIAENINNSWLSEINKFLEDIYEARKEDLASGNQYGIKNLVFKELRNKGYLDNLKDLRNEIISKELSLESLNEANTQPLTESNTESFLTITSNDLQLYLAWAAKNMSFEEIFKQTIGKSQEEAIKTLFVSLLFAIVLKCEAKKIEQLKDTIYDNINYNTQLLKDSISKVCNDPKLVEVLNYIIEAMEDCTTSSDLIDWRAEFGLIINGSTLVGVNGTHLKKEIIIPNGVTKIDTDAFKHNPTIEHIIIAKSVKTISTSAFDGCRRLQTVIFEAHSRLVNIEKDAFYGCSQLYQLEIPLTVQSIGSGAFANCTQLQKNNITKCT